MGISAMLCVSPRSSDYLISLNLRAWRIVSTGSNASRTINFQQLTVNSVNCYLLKVALASTSLGIVFDKLKEFPRYSQVCYSNITIREDLPPAFTIPLWFSFKINREARALPGRAKHLKGKGESRRGKPQVFHPNKSHSLPTLSS